jgi:hypothetical protein
MEFVFFGKELPDLAPDVIRPVFDVEGETWASMLDVTVALLEGKDVTVRQASPTEMARAEALVRLHFAGMQIVQSAHCLLEQEGQDAANAAVNRMIDMFYSADDVTYHLLDQ